MLPVLVILNCVALIALILVWGRMPRKFKLIFSFSSIFSLLLLGLIASLGFNVTDMGPVEVLLLLLRGGLLFALLFGALSCYIAYRFFHTK